MNALVRAERTTCNRLPERHQAAPHAKGTGLRDVKTETTPRLRMSATLDGRLTLPETAAPMRCANSSATRPIPPVVAWMRIFFFADRCMHSAKASRIVHHRMGNVHASSNERARGMRTWTRASVRVVEVRQPMAMPYVESPRRRCATRSPAAPSTDAHSRPIGRTVRVGSRSSMFSTSRKLSPAACTLSSTWALESFGGR